MDPYIVFNKSLKTFLRELVATFPKVKEFSVLHIIYKMCKSISRKSPQRYFKEILLSPYRECLINEDDSFMDTNIFNSCSLPLHIQILLQDMKNIQQIWKEIDPSNKHTIWQHIKILVHNSDLCDF